MAPATTAPRSAAFSAANEEMSVSLIRVRSIAPVHSHPLTRNCVFSSSFAKTTCRAAYSSYTFSFTTIPCRALLSSFNMSLILLLHHGRGPGLVNFLCHNCHNHVLGFTVLLRHVRGPFIIHHLQHNHAVDSASSSSFTTAGPRATHLTVYVPP